MLPIIRSMTVPFLNLYIRYRKDIYVSKNSKLDRKVYTGSSMRGTKPYPIIIYNSDIGNIVCREGCKFFNCVCQGKVEIGRFVTLAGPGVKICGNVNGIKIGSFSSIAAGTVIQEGQHNYRRLTTYFINRNIFNNNSQEEISKGEVVIGEGVWIGSNVIVLDGVTIGRGAVIGAGAVVTKDVPPYAIAVGNPAHVIKYRFDIDVVSRVESTEWWNWDIDKLKQYSAVFSTEDFIQHLNELEQGEL